MAKPGDNPNDGPGSKSFMDRAERLSDIHRFCQRLEEAWSSTPNLRFGQLIENVNYVGFSPRPLFYREDREVLDSIEKFCGTSHDA